jgi:twinkle protein
VNNFISFKNVLNENIDIKQWMDEEHQARIATVGCFVEPVMKMVMGVGENALNTPWSSLDGKFGFRESELTIWSGFKGHGKSLVISQVFEKFITDGKKCFIISPEFPPHRVLYRMMQQSMGVNNINTENAFSWLEAVEDQLWLYDQQSSLKPTDVVALCRYAVEVHGVEHILIDSLMKCGIPPDDYGTQKKLVDMIQQVAHKNKVHIHLVAHARKGNDDSKIGGLHDIKGSSEIADMAENVIFVWRNKPKEFDRSNHLEEPDCIVKVEAQRNADGWIGTIPLWFRSHNFTFSEGNI